MSLVSKCFDVHSFVNIYLVNRSFGGPEEGGWWYDHGWLQCSIPVLPKETSAEVIERYTPYIASLNEGRNTDIGSMKSDGEYRAIVEEHSGRDWPDKLPRYE